MDFKRARKAEQKEERRKGILATARELCDENGVMDWSLNELGRRAAVNKSNLYRYFGSREEILMTLMQEEMVTFVDQFSKRVENRKLTAVELGEIIATLYHEQPFLCELLVISASILEQKVEVEAIKEIKLQSVALSARIARDIANALDHIDEEAARKIALTSSLLAVGLWPMAKPSAPARELAKLEGLEWLALSFQRELSDALHAYVTGLQSRYRSQTPQTEPNDGGQS